MLSTLYNIYKQYKGMIYHWNKKVYQTTNDENSEINFTK